MFRVPGFIDARIDFAELLNCCCLVAYALQNAGGHSFSRRKKDLTHRVTDYPKFCIGMPVVRTEGRADGRALYGHVITNDRLVGFSSPSLPIFFLNAKL